MTRERAPGPNRAAFPPIRAIGIGLLWLAAFSLLFTIGAENGAWPDLEPARLRDLDLVVGFFAGVAVLVALAVRGRETGAVS